MGRQWRGGALGSPATNCGEGRGSGEGARGGTGRGEGIYRGGGTTWTRGRSGARIGEDPGSFGIPASGGGVGVGRKKVVGPGVSEREGGGCGRLAEAWGFRARGLGVGWLAGAAGPVGSVGLRLVGPAGLARWLGRLGAGWAGWPGWRLGFLFPFFF